MLIATDPQLQVEYNANLVKRQEGSNSIGYLVTILGALVTQVSDLARKKPTSKVPDIAQQESDWGDGAKRRKIRYGPYRIPPISVSLFRLCKSGTEELMKVQESNVETRLYNQKGIANTLTVAARKPFNAEGVILDLSASLEYDDGTTAENEQGVRGSAIDSAISAQVSRLTSPQCRPGFTTPSLSMLEPA
jgi:hypothetical protein